MGLGVAEDEQKKDDGEHCRKKRLGCGECLCC